MKKKIYGQFILLTTIAILTTVSLSLFVFYELFQKEVIEDLRSYTKLVVDTGAWQDIVSGTYESQSSAAGQIRITLINLEGNAEYDSNVQAATMENHSERPEISKALQTGEGQAIRQSATIGKNLFYYAIRLDNGYVLRAAKEAESMTSVFTSVIPSVIIILVLLFALCLLLSHFLTKSIIQPIESLAKNLDSPDSIMVYKEIVPFVTTIQKQHEDILKNANMRQEFTANVSHELKTPLTSISGYSELIASGMAADKDIVRFATEIHKNSNRLLTLINDIIRMSQLDNITEQNDFEMVDVYEIAANCVEMLEMSAKKHNVTLSLHGRKRLVYANRQMMDEMIYNLCDNAIRYNNSGGRVDVTVDIGYVLMENGTDNSTVIEVKDTGIGIPAEHQERIFERFYRVDKSRSKSTGGTGLGLAIVKHIIAIHDNASLYLESEEGKGTRIRVLFENTRHLMSKE